MTTTTTVATVLYTMMRIAFICCARRTRASSTCSVPTAKPVPRWIAVQTRSLHDAELDWSYARFGADGAAGQGPTAVLLVVADRRDLSWLDAANVSGRAE